jgi:hypothetical protein
MVVDRRPQSQAAAGVGAIARIMLRPRIAEAARTPENVPPSTPGAARSAPVRRSRAAILHFAESVFEQSYRGMAPRPEPSALASTT